MTSRLDTATGPRRHVTLQVLPFQKFIVGKISLLYPSKIKNPSRAHFFLVTLQVLPFQKLYPVQISRAIRFRLHLDKPTENLPLVQKCTPLSTLSNNLFSPATNLTNLSQSY